jgi:hypothetical protein
MVLAVSVPPLVAAVGQRYQQTARGVVTFRLHRVFDVHAGPQSRHDDLVLDGVYSGGTLVSVRILSDTVGGKAQSAEQIATAEYQWTHPKPGDVFCQPFDPRCFTGYAYRPLRNGTIAFTALVSDGSHGSGSFTYDALHNVTSFTYRPSVMPQYARSGTVSDVRSKVLTGYWASTHETQQYSGHYALWNGGATVDYTWSGFARFATVPAAVRAIKGP